MTRRTPKLARRTFIKAASAAVAAPYIVPSSVLGQDAPSKKVTMGIIGAGWQGGANLGSFLGIDRCRVIAVADVDAKHLNSAVGRVNGHYKNDDCKGYHDFRELIARNDIDTVCISTPDHWHALPAIMAAKAGKDIFGEKPLSHTLAEGIAMVQAVTGANRIWQTGSWQRSQAHFRLSAQIVRNGMIGKVQRVEVGLPNGHADFAKTGKRCPDGEPPAELDYEFWLGPAASQPYNRCRSHKNWRWNYNTGGGQLMDWIGHHCDIAHWGLGDDDKIGPLEVKATAEFPPATNIWNTATKFRVECKYPGDIEVVIAGGYPDIQGGAKWIGTDGWVRIDRGKHEASNMDLFKEVSRGEKDGTLKVRFDAPRNHWHNFIDSVVSRKPTLTPIEVAHRSQTPGHLGYIASRVDRTLKWDAQKQQIIGDDEATKLMSKTYRSPWTL